MLKGIAVSPGIGIGKAVLVGEEEIEVVQTTVQDISAEQRRFTDATQVFAAQIEQACQMVRQNVGESEAAILGAQLEIIRDPELTREVLRTIEREQVNAEHVFNLICDGYIALFSSLEDELIRARSADFRDIKHRMLCILMGIPRRDLTQLEPGSILVAEDIPPSQASSIDVNKIRGIVTQAGTRFSHIAILARALELPTVMAVDNLLFHVEEGSTLIVDGRQGLVLCDPTDHQLKDYQQQMEQAGRRRVQLEDYKNRKTVTADKKRIHLRSNLAMAQELKVIGEHRADGIGLFRSEFLYMQRQQPPTESQQYSTYRQVAEAMEGKPVVMRTMDVGGDKDIPFLGLPREDNPYLGFRAVRVCLSRPDLFKTQLAAMLRAAVHGDVRIMIPMITSVTELRQVKELVRQVKEELTHRGEAFGHQVPLGIMLETPAAMICAADLAGEADFFSIGTNDLTQYILAVDRGNEQVASLYNPLHPAVLRSIAAAVAAAQAAGVEVGVCGEAAGDPLCIPFFLGLGITELSVSSGLLLSVRCQLNSLDSQYWQQQIPSILKLQTADEIADFIRQRVSPLEL